ncbi:MAG: deoxyguanosinetriphosphate triphosphohydrolase [Desulfobacterium sp.]|nr:deoxyguanosinetriphosphate triphosphohydrolase [Desulfobacterium sp.]
MTFARTTLTEELETEGVSTKNKPPSIRELFQKREQGFLSEFACPSSKSAGRLRQEDPCSIRTPFQLDRDRIVYSNAFRRLKHKTQVFLSPMGDHYRTRLTHTLEVSEIARNIARAMSLNEDLTEAIALGHDLGHTPFGHGGETALKEIFSPDFSHQEQSLRVVDTLDNKGLGLNLTHEVRDGILKHSKGFGDIMPTTPGEAASTVEGKIVRIADIIAYLNHDLDDALRSRVITRNEVPAVCVDKLGTSHSKRAKTMIEELVYNSGPEDGNFKLSMGGEIFSAMTVLRQFLYDQVYRSPSVHKEFIKAKKVLIELYHYFMDNTEKLQQELAKMEMAHWDPQETSLERSVCDLIASMTDRYALNLYAKLFFPRSHF